MAIAPQSNAQCACGSSRLMQLTIPKVGSAHDAKGPEPSFERFQEAAMKLGSNGRSPVSVRVVNVIANLELLPLKLNESKNDKIGDRQRDMAKKFHAAGLLSAAGLKAVEAR